MMKTHLLAAIVAVLLPAVSHAQATRETIKLDMIGCRTKPDYERVERLSREGDNAAVVRFIGLKVTSGDCIILKTGTKVTVQQDTLGVLSTSLCVRPDGNIECVWTNMRTIR